MRLENKTAIVTGAASGLGKAIVKKFLEEGSKVIIVDINEDAARELSKDLGPKTLAVKADIGDTNSVENLKKSVFESFERVDIVVNNAGVTHLPTPLDEVTEEDFDRVFRVNCKSVYLMAKAFVPEMKNQGSGSILTMAVELAPFGVRVNAVNPVASETPLLASFMGEDTPEIRQKFLSTIPLGRFAQPEDIANAACYLSSEEASMVTGVCMQVDGGRCI
jgi:3-oxoacyl-[acyl-carrier protein] reductase